jgi:hypothetical protein
MHIKIWLEKLEETDYFEDLDTGQMILLKKCLKKADYDRCANFVYMAHNMDQWWVSVSILMNFGVQQKIS